MSLKGVKNVLGTVLTFTKQNSPIILTAAAVVGTVTTVALAIKATPKAEEALEKVEEEKQEEITTMDKVKAVAPHYIPAAIMLTLTICAIIFAQGINTRRQAALLAAYQLSEDRIDKFESAAEKTIGEKKLDLIRSKMGQEDIDNDPPNNLTAKTRETDLLWRDDFSGQYFWASKDDIKEAKNYIDEQINKGRDVCVNDFLEILEVDGGQKGSEYGFGNELIHLSMNSTGEVKNCINEALNGQACHILYYDTHLLPSWI